MDIKKLSMIEIEQRIKDFHKIKVINALVLFNILAITLFKATTGRYEILDMVTIAFVFVGFFYSRYIEEKSKEAIEKNMRY